jgi:hypothetical protein
MKEKLRKAGNALLAAVTSPEAVTAEKSLAVLVVTRLALALGASAGLAELIVQLIQNA